jgi:hypothetical protein
MGIPTINSIYVEPIPKNRWKSCTRNGEDTDKQFL